MPDRAIRQSYRGFSIRRVIEARCLGFTKKITDASSAALSCRQKGHIFPRKPSTAPLSARSLKRDKGEVQNSYLFERHIANALEGHQEFMIAGALPLKMAQSGTISTYSTHFCSFPRKVRMPILTSSMKHRKDSCTHLVEVFNSDKPAVPYRSELYSHVPTFCILVYFRRYRHCIFSMPQKP